MENEDITLLEGKCLSYASNVAYLPVIDILKANFRIEDGNEPDLVKSKVYSSLADMGIDLSSTLPYLLDLLSVKGSGVDELNISPEIKKERIIESLHRIILKGSEQRPLLLIFEDLHWVDNSTEALLKDILETIPGSKVLLLFSYRPEYVHTWGGKSYHNQLNLNRLSNRESLNMLSYLLGSEAIEEGVKELVLSKTEGIPFFIEEFVKSLTNLKLIEKRDKFCLVKDIETLTIPSTIQDMIMARVDALPDMAKEVLQAGSVIEREFSLAVIKQVLDLPEQELLTSLALLKDSELIYERGIYPDSTYIFKHALTREVIYNSILAKRKIQLHENTGMSIETLFKENVEEHYASLVEHFMNSRNYNKAAAYSRLAGRKARRSFSPHESFAFQRKAISCYEQLPQTDDTKAEIIHTKVSLGGYYMGLNYHVEAKEVVEPILELASQMGFEKYLSQIWSIMSWYYMTVELDMPKSISYLEKAWQKAEEADDEFSKFQAYLSRGWIFWAAAEYERAIDGWKKTGESQFGRHIVRIVQRKSALAHIYFYLGQIEKSFQLSHEADMLARESGLVESISYTTIYASKGLAHFGKGNLKEAEQYLLKQKALTFKLQNHVWYIMANINLADIYCELQDFEAAEHHYKTAHQCHDQTKLVPHWGHVSILGIARAGVMLGETEVDLEMLRTITVSEDANSTKGWKARYMGEILLNIDGQHMSEAESWIKKAISANTEAKMRFMLAQDHALYSDFFKRQDNLPQAREQMNKAVEIMKECKADGWVEKYEKELAVLS